MAINGGYEPQVVGNVVIREVGVVKQPTAGDAFEGLEARDGVRGTLTEEGACVKAACAWLNDELEDGVGADLGVRRRALGGRGLMHTRARRARVGCVELEDGTHAVRGRRRGRR